MNKNINRIVEEFYPEKSSTERLIHGLKNFYSVKEIKENIWTYMLSIPLSLLIAIPCNTISLIEKISAAIYPSLLTIFAGLLTFYTIILAMINRKNVETLTKNQNNKQTILAETIEYYERVLFLYFLGFFISFILNLYMQVIPANFVLTGRYFLDCTLAFFLLVVYINSIFRLLWELKSTIHNTFNFSRASIVNILIEILNGEESSR